MHIVLKIKDGLSMVGTISLIKLKGHQFEFLVFFFFFKSPFKNDLTPNLSQRYGNDH
jgi:hypothetical protein